MRGTGDSSPVRADEYFSSVSESVSGAEVSLLSAAVGELRGDDAKVPRVDELERDRVRLIAEVSAFSCLLSSRDSRFDVLSCVLDSSLDNCFVNVVSQVNVTP